MVGPASVLKVFRTAALGWALVACASSGPAPQEGRNENEREAELLTAPAAPTKLAAQGVSEVQIDLQWDDGADNESGFQIERRSEGGAYALLVTVAADAVSFSDAGLEAGKAYGYRVRAFNTAGVSAYSNEASAVTAVPPETAPESPANLTASPVAAYRIDLAWSDRSDNESAFVVERKANPAGAYAALVTLGANATAFSDVSVSPSQTYSYRVFAANSAGVSEFSNEAAATTPAPPKPPYGSMVTIPAGTFTMGDAFGEGTSAELPTHDVWLREFEIDVYEVTNGQYAACVSAAACTPPAYTSSSQRDAYYGTTTYATFPVMHVTWYQASAFCVWKEKRLPTEAEWEKAARGKLAGKRFPWGDTIDCSQANYKTTDTLAYDVDPFAGSRGCNFIESSSDVTDTASYQPNGYGLYDMAGNVSEWVSDWGNSAYYASSPTADPQGPVSGIFKVTRGGNYGVNAEALRVANRTPNYDPAESYWGLGFRCAR